MRKKAFLRDLGLMEYKKVHMLQLDLVERRKTGDLPADIFLFTEHPAVFTLGRRGGLENLIVPTELLRQRGVEVVPLERGGNITFHGPGQLVVYPIILLREAGLSVADYVFRLEEAMIGVSRDCGVAAARDPRNHGVWVGDRKIGSVGIAIRHGVSFHGLALNVNTDLDIFNWIRPCGLANVGVASIAAELGKEKAMREVKKMMSGHLAEVFGLTFDHEPGYEGIEY